MREVHGEVAVVLLGDVPVGRVGEHLAVAVAPGVHVLDREPHVRLVGHPPHPAHEVAGVGALPAEGRVHHDGGRAQPLGRRPGPLELHPRVGGPHPLGDQQAGGVHGEDRHPVVVGQPAQRLHVLADGIGPHHDLDAVVAEPGGDLEGGGGGLGVDRGGGQRDLRLPAGLAGASGFPPGPPETSGAPRRPGRPDRSRRDRARPERAACPLERSAGSVTGASVRPRPRPARSPARPPPPSCLVAPLPRAPRCVRRHAIASGLRPTATVLPHPVRSRPPRHRGLSRSSSTRLRPGVPPAPVAAPHRGAWGHLPAARLGENCALSRPPAGGRRGPEP